MAASEARGWPVANYGIPYQGSKSKIAPWVVEHLPSSDVLVDLFAGGCAITHCALESGRFGSVVANDLTCGPEVFLAAVNGEFDGYDRVPTHAEFDAEKKDDDALALLYSFGNNRQDYLWGPDNERIKVPATRMVLAPSVWERKKAYREFMKALAESINLPNQSLEPQERISRLLNLQSLQGIERLGRLVRLEGANTSALVTTKLDYREVEVPDGATVYADPPYRGTDCKAYRDVGKFDFDAFDEWLASVPFPVIVSEYTCPEGCVEIDSRKKRVTMDSNSNSKVAVEGLFVQERFLGEYRKRMASDRLFGEAPNGE